MTAPNDDSDASRSEFVQAWDIEPVDEGDFPMNVPGPWGRENITLGVRTIREGHAGPGTPPTQPTWSGLVRRFFCNRFWHPYERPPKALC